MQQICVVCLFVCLWVVCCLFVAVVFVVGHLLFYFFVGVLLGFAGFHFFIFFFRV